MHKISVILLVVAMAFVTEFVKAESSNPSIYSYRLGGMKITALLNREIYQDKSIFRYSDGLVLEETLKLPDSNKASLNEFVVEIDDKVVLFDTGINPEMTLAGLKEAGYEIEDIDIVIITHMHKDHIGGLMDENYRIIFPTQDIYIAQEELDANSDEYLIKLYNGRIKAFKQNENILPNIRSVPAFGHTKGHTMFELSSQGKKMLIWGDLVNAAIQFSHPEIYSTYDTDPSESVETRMRFMEQLSQEDTIIAGMHVVFPGMGVVTKEREGMYKFVPLKRKIRIQHENN